MVNYGKGTALESHLAERLRSRARRAKLRHLQPSPPGSIDFSSNDFLSLATNPEFRQDFLTEMLKDEFPVGSTGSRLLDGNSSYAEKLEADISTFHGAEAGLLTNSGFDANVSIFMCLPQRQDIIVYDELIHASVHDGMRQSRAKTTIPFKHNSVMHLEEILLPYVDLEPTHNIFVAVESVYSMDGDLAPLAEIVALTGRMFPNGNCHLIVDEAHATGVYGSKGRGRVSELGLETKFLVRLHTFGKALACNGAIILCSDILKQYLINYARPLIYTTFMSYSSLNAIQVAYNWLMSGRTEPLAQNLLHLITHLHTKLQILDKQITSSSFRHSTMPTSQSILKVPSTCPDSPIFALVSDQYHDLASYCQKAGFNVRHISAPTVPLGTERVRVCLHAGNTTEQIDDFVECVGRWVRKQGVGERRKSSSYLEEGNMDEGDAELRAKL